MASTIGKETLNTFGGGMNTDVDVSILKQTQYRYAENARVSMNDSSTFGALSAIQKGLEVPSIDFAGQDIKGTATVRDIGVVFANESGLGKIFRVSFNSGGSMVKTQIFSSSHLFSNGISIVILHEDIDNIKAYFAEKGSLIRVINISDSADSYNLAITDIDKLSFSPPSELAKPIINSIDTGNLMAGRYQYCYRLYSKYGTESVVSPLSNGVDLNASSSEGLSSFVVGSDQDRSSGKSISVKIPYTDGFNYIKIISIFYKTSIDEPIVSLVTDNKFTNSGGYFYFMDSGAGAIDSILQDELNQIGLSSFMARHLETKDNILFAADVEDTNFEIDPEYDTRAFQFNRDGEAKLYSADMLNASAITISALDVGRWSISKDHDCINKDIFIKDKYSDIAYKYDLSGNLGGEGVSVKYNFINTYFIESYGNALNKPLPLTMKDKLIDGRVSRIGDRVHQDLSFIAIKSSSGQFLEQSLSSFGIATHNGYLNYANSMLSEPFRSYQRDEIYRFAAVFYDKSGRRSDAKWIADIRFPANYEKNSKWNASSFEMPEEIVDSVYDGAAAPSGIKLGDQELLIKPLGLMFKFKSVPPGVKKIEIVRTKRDLFNRTIIAQGVVQKTGTRRIEYRDTGNEYVRGKINTLRPHPVLAMGYSYSSLGPFIETSPSYKAYGANGISGYNRTHELAKTLSAPDIADNVVRKAIKYTDHALAPYYSDRSNFMFISPEVSYYKDEYANTVKDSYPAAKLVVSDIIYPKATPALLYGGLIKSPQAGEVYIGSGMLVKAQTTTSAFGGSSYMMPTLMYFGADLNAGLIGTTILLTAGLLGADHRSIYNEGAPRTEERTYTTSSVSSSQPTMDIYPNTTSHIEPLNGIRAYIALGSFMTAVTNNNNGFIPVNQSLYNRPQVFNYSVNSAPISTTFKYFCNFNSKFNTSSAVGGESVILIYQNSNVISDRTEVAYSNIGAIPSFDLSDMAYASEIDPGVRTVDNSLLINSPAAKYIQIGTKLFLNYHSGLTRGDAIAAIDATREGLETYTASLMNTKVSGPHGDGLLFEIADNGTFPSILKIKSSRKKYSYNSAYDKYRVYEGYKNLDEIGSSAMGTFVVNLKSMNSSIYGGISYHNRKYSEYVSTGAVISNPIANVESAVFGGDTYIGIFDYTIIRATDPMLGNGIEVSYYGGGAPAPWVVSETTAEMFKVGNVNALIPLETSINMRMSSSKSFITSRRESFIQEKPGLYNATTTSNYTPNTAIDFSQSFYNHKYNSAYSADKTGFLFITNISDYETLRKDCRVMASDKKTVDEVFDSWATFRAANYIDVDTRYGQITRLKTFSNKLFFLQEDAVGVLSVNDRSLIKDNNVGELVLGSGGVLDRYDYINTNNGLDKDAINSISTSATAMYWYDHRRSELCVMSDGVGSLSKSAGIQKILNKNTEAIQLNIPIGYDRKYNEMLFTMTGMPSIKNQIK